MTLNSWNVPKGPTPEQVKALEQYALDHGDEWKCRLHADWTRAGSSWSGPYHLLQRIWDRLGRTSAARWLVDYEPFADEEGDVPKQRTGRRIRMSVEEEKRRRLKRKVEHKAKLARKHARSTVAEEKDNRK